MFFEDINLKLSSVVIRLSTIITIVNFIFINLYQIVTDNIIADTIPEKLFAATKVTIKIWVNAIYYSLNIFFAIIYHAVKSFFAIICYAKGIILYNEITIILGIFALFITLYLHRKKSENYRHVDDFYKRYEFDRHDKYERPIRISNLHNNHDNQKVRHCSQKSAEDAIMNMRYSGKDSEHRLVSYYNTKLKAWFVGNSW